MSEHHRGGEGSPGANVAEKVRAEEGGRWKVAPNDPEKEAGGGWSWRARRSEMGRQWAEWVQVGW